MLFVGALVAAVTLRTGADDSLAVLVYRLAAGLLVGIGRSPLSPARARRSAGSRRVHS
jgi:hypothetical protein